MKRAVSVVAVVWCAATGHAQSPRGAAHAPRAAGADAPFPIVETTVDQVHAAYKSRTLTVRQLVQAYLDRIDAYDKKGPTINCIITINPRALEDADALDRAFKQSGTFIGPMHGIPIVVKDEIDTVGMPTTEGTLVFKDYRPTKDAFVVERLRKAGAIILGKTTLSEFAGGDTYGSLFGVTRNPYDLERTVGGSSGGSGAALAANFSMLALGEETSASIRRPGAWNAIVSLRPTPGLVSRSGMWDGYPSPTAQMGPMARSVRDLARLLDAMVGYDPEDPVTALGLGQAPDSYARSLDTNGLKGARIGVLRESIGQQSEPASEDFKKVDAAFEKNVANSPFASREDIARSPDMTKSIPPSKARVWEGPRPVTDLSKWGEYLQAREQLLINISKVMADNRLDAIVHKSVEHQPALIKDGINPPYTSAKGVPTLNTFLVYAASMTVPSGFTSDHLPVGMTFFGRPYSEPTLIKLAYSYEQATHHRIPPRTTPPLGRPVDPSVAHAIGRD